MICIYYSLLVQMCSFNVLMPSLNIPTASLNVTSALDLLIFFSNTANDKTVYYRGFLQKNSHLLSVSLPLSVSDEKSNFITSIVSDDLQNEHFSSIQLSSSKVQLNFSIRPCGLVGKISLKILFRFFNRFARTEEHPHISYENDVCSMLEMNVYSSWSLRKFINT